MLHLGILAVELLDDRERVPFLRQACNFVLRRIQESNLVGLAQEVHLVLERVKGDLTIAVVFNRRLIDRVSFWRYLVQQLHFLAHAQIAVSAVYFALAAQIAWRFVQRGCNFRLHADEATGFRFEVVSLGVVVDISSDVE